MQKNLDIPIKLRLLLCFYYLFDISLP